jgi:hypothetical protein
MGRKFRQGLGWLVCVWLFFGCGKSSESLILPATSPLAGDIWWGLTKSSYLRLSPDLANNAVAGAVLRQGDVVKIIEIRSVYDNEKRFWVDYYLVVVSDNEQQGWILASEVERFDYREAAQQSRQRLIQTGQLQ